MFNRPKSFSVLYGIQRSFLNLFYLVSVIAVFWILFYFLHDVLSLDGKVIIPVSIAYLVIIVLVYSIINVISYIPANLAGAFDPLKNGIADGSISSIPEFSGKLADFLCSFFNFAFFDIEFAMVRIEGYEPAVSGIPLSDADQISMDAWEKEVLSLQCTGYFSKVKSDAATLHLYLIPLIFGDRRIGFIAAGTRQKLMGPFIKLLDEFENDYLDDQIIHLVERQGS
jgi:hypothetical protein